MNPFSLCLRASRIRRSFPLHRSSHQLQFHPQPAMVTQRSNMTTTVVLSPRDPNTISNYHEFITRHTTVNLEIDFKKKALKGRVDLVLDSLNHGTSQEIILDSSYVEVSSVTVNNENVKWELRPRSEPYGSALRIALHRAFPKGTCATVRVGVPVITPIVVGSSNTA